MPNSCDRQFEQQVPLNQEFEEPSMSEYQYYEFQALDRPLTQAQRDAISRLSSRVKPTATTAQFTYSHGDFPGDPQEILAQYFDVMYYIANWGTQQLTFRFPQSLISQTEIAPYCLEDCISLSWSGDWAILDWQFNTEEGLGWIEGEGTLSELLELRQEILQQDYRGLYLAWLKAIALSPEYADIDKTQLEPPVPPGLHQLSPAQNAFSEIFGLDKNLLAVAAAASKRKTTALSESTLQQAIAQLSPSEGRDFLLRLAKGESNLSAKFKQRLSEFIAPSPTFEPGQRTIQQLLDAASQEEKAVKKREKQEAKLKSIQELEALAQREARAWDEVEVWIQKSQAQTYDQAVELLVKLRDLAEHQNRSAAFQEKMNRIYDQYSRRSSFMKRLQKAGL